MEISYYDEAGRELDLDRAKMVKTGTSKIVESIDNTVFLKN